ncbi:MAG: hypothetical protein ACI4MA_01385 [Treponema sp.]
MKKLIIITLALSFLNISCGRAKLKTKTVNIKKIASYEIFDDDYFVSGTKSALNKININTVAFSYGQLKSFEDESFSRPLMDIIYNTPSVDMYYKILDYLSSANFKEDYFVLYDNQMYDSSSRTAKTYNDFPLENDGIIIGEYAFLNHLYHSFPYKFIYVSRYHLILTTIELNRPDISVFEECKEFFVKTDTESSLPYYWVSDQKRKEFFEILESDKYKTLPKEFQLLREAKDLFLETLTIHEKDN